MTHSSTAKALFAAIALLVAVLVVYLFLPKEQTTQAIEITHYESVENEKVNTWFVIFQNNTNNYVYFLDNNTVYIMVREDGGLRDSGYRGTQGGFRHMIGDPGVDSVPSDGTRSADKIYACSDLPSGNYVGIVYFTYDVEYARNFTTTNQPDPANSFYVSFEITVG